MEKKEVPLQERDIKRLKIDLENHKIQLISLDAALNTYKKYADSGIYKKRHERGVEKMEEMVKSGKTEEGKELEDFEVEDLKIQIDARKEEMDKDKPTKELKKAIMKAEFDIENTKNNIKVLEKQIRERKAITTQ